MDKTALINEVKIYKDDVIQAYLKTIWHEFNPDDETTWPKNNGNGYFYIVRCVDGSTDYWHFYGEKSMERYWDYVTHYLDPADITPSEVG